MMPNDNRFNCKLFNGATENILKLHINNANGRTWVVALSIAFRIASEEM